jgi:peptidoglycan hydrolase-like protein with peptidoglycan-binding domain
VNIRARLPVAKTAVMKRILALFLMLAAGALHADELTRRAQESLKELGFFYGEVTGVSSPETTAAIRRYQIRNGLEVTGTLNDGTLKALGLKDGEPTPAPTPAPAPRSASPKKQPPVNLRREPTEADADREFIRREESRGRVERDPSAVSPPAPLTPPPEPGMEEYAKLFERTPYESAPAELQVGTLRKAQTLLARGGYYRGVIDGIPGPETEQAILIYQRSRRLPLTGHLDIATLNEMLLLPGNRNGPPVKSFKVPRGSRQPTRVYRGIWVD